MPAPAIGRSPQPGSAMYSESSRAEHTQHALAIAYSSTTSQGSDSPSRYLIPIGPKMASEIMPCLSPDDFKPPPTMFDPATCTRKGLCPVTQLRGQGEVWESHSLYYEVHGSGPEKVVFIMGLSSTSAAWLSQVEYFVGKPEYSVLVFDNRGVGNSGAPRGPYTTSGMAEDVVTLLDFIGWKEKNQIHVVGVSLGGMIAQELATKITERIVSLTLVVTKSGRRRLIELPSYLSVKTLARTTFMRGPERRITLVMEMLFPNEWLEAKSSSDPEGRTNREVETVAYCKRFAIAPPQTMLGSISQIAAALTHYISPERLQKISSTIPKVVIVTGDRDNLINPSNSYMLKDSMPEAELIVREGAAHGVTMQCKQWFNELLEKTFKEARERA